MEGEKFKKAIKLLEGNLDDLQNLMDVLVENMNRPEEELPEWVTEGDIDIVEYVGRLRAQMPKLVKVLADLDQMHTRYRKPQGEKHEQD